MITFSIMNNYTFEVRLDEISNKPQRINTNNNQ